MRSVRAGAAFLLAAAIAAGVVASAWAQQGQPAGIQVFLPVTSRNMGLGAGGGGTPPAQPTPTPPPPQTTNWLQWLNQLRDLADLPPVTENTDWSAGGVEHSRYMVKTGTIGHDQPLGGPWASAAGLAAAQNGNVTVSGNVNATDRQLINSWVSGPFHMIGMIDPRLTQSAFGAWREAGVSQWSAAGTLDVLRGRVAQAPASVTFPVIWPGNAKTLPADLVRYPGGEYPDPLTACVGFTTPTGQPLYVQVATSGPRALTATMTQNGAPIETCVYDGGSYTNADAGAQSLARSILNGRNAIVIIPRQPLVLGATYTVTLTVNGAPIVWTFTVAAS